MLHFEKELEGLRERLLEMSGMVASAIHGSVRSLTEKDAQRALEVLRNEDRVNKLQMEVDELSTELLALRQPVALDLRFITAAMRINVDLERMGDLAVSIAKRTRHLIEKPEVKPSIDIPQIADRVEAMVHQSLDAFIKKDPRLARTVLESDDAVDGLRNEMYDELVHFMQSNPSAIPQAIDYMLIVRNLERIADHATNIAEDVIFMVEGIDVRHNATPVPVLEPHS